MTRASVANPNRTCADCDRWVRHDTNDATGECRANPPQVIDAIVLHELQADARTPITDAVLEATRWPITVEHYSCAKFARAGGEIPL